MSVFPIKAELDVCSDYHRCFALGKSVCANNGHEHGCVGCDIYRAYLIGFSQGASQAVEAMRTVKPAFSKPMLRDSMRGDV
jgi:hypothetical protein